MTIRDLGEGDASDCKAIANNAFSDEIKKGMDSFTAEYFLTRMKSKTQKCVVATEKETVLGFMIVTDTNKYVPAQLHLVAIDKEQRGKGLGKQLVQYAIDYVVNNNWEKMRLFTRPWNTPMRKVCEKLGFEQEAHLKKEYLGEDIIQYGYFPKHYLQKKKRK